MSTKEVSGRQLEEAVDEDFDESEIFDGLESTKDY